MLATLAGAAVTDACGGPKGIALAADIGERHARRWAAGERSSAVYRAATLIRNARRRRWELVRYFAAVAVQADLQEAAPLSEGRVKQLWAEVDRAEAANDAAEDVERVGFDYTGDLEALYEADARTIAPTLKRMALNILSQRMGWDPRPTPTKARGH